MKIEMIKHLSLSNKDKTLNTTIEVETIIPKEDLSRISVDAIANARKVVEEDI
jgi:hypothetical protein